MHVRPTHLCLSRKDLPWKICCTSLARRLLSVSSNLLFHHPPPPPFSAFFLPLTRSCFLVLFDFSVDPGRTCTLLLGSLSLLFNLRRTPALHRNHPILRSPPMAGFSFLSFSFSSSSVSKPSHPPMDIPLSICLRICLDRERELGMSRLSRHR